MTATLIALSIVVGLLSAYAAIEWSLRQDARDREQITKARREAERIRSALDGGK